MRSFIYPYRFLGLVLLSLLVLGEVSCKSKKAAHTTKPPAKNKELKALGEKLNLGLERNDNIVLYRFVGSWLGTPHKLGSCTTAAIDCSCFVQLLFTEVYQYKLPRTAAEMHKHCRAVDADDLREGDLVFFKINATKVSHVGVYLKEGWFAHVSTSRGVMINNLSEAYYNKHFTGGGRRP